MAIETKTIACSDREARERALDTASSFVVQAPAGSGKTELLMQRFLALLAMAGRPEEILALTFTRKAAGEMQSRIISAMRRAGDGAPPEAAHELKTHELARRALARDAELGWGLTENPGRLKVQTMDSFSSSVVRSTPILSGLSRHAVTDKPKEYYLEAAQRTIALVEADGAAGEAVRKALAHLDNSVKPLTDRLVAMLGKREQWLRHVKGEMAREELRALLEGSIGRLVEYELKAAEAAFPPGLSGPLLRSARHAAANIEKPESPVRHLAEMAAMPGARASQLALWKGLAALLLTEKGEWRKARGVDVRLGFPNDKKGAAAEIKMEFQGILYGLGGNDSLRRALAAVAALPEPRFTDAEWDSLCALLDLLPTAERYLNEAFLAAGEVDFQAVSLSALKALGTEDSPTDLMLAIDLKVQHILVDEYQDTSHMQLALLEAVTRGWTPGDGRTLFVVGDPMQSIYLFREAEVGLFLEAQLKGIGGVPMEPLRLARNFRSGDGIVGWVNSEIMRAFPEEEDTFTGSVAYSPSVAAKEGFGSVQVTVYNGRADRAEAREVASLLKSIPAGETAAVLCRSRAHLASIIPELSSIGVGFRAEELDPLSQRPVVRDLLALLRALDHPCDRVAWLACLRAPWAGLGLPDLLALCAGDPASPMQALMADAERVSRVSADGRARMERFLDIFCRASASWGRVRPSELVRGLWIELGGPACLKDALEMRDAERFLELLEDSEGPGYIDMALLEERLEGLNADHGAEGSPVKLMTIHKAKGLEFDHVVLPGLGRPPRNDDRELLVWMERGEADLLLAPIEGRSGRDGSGVYGYLTGIRKKRSELEEARLLYVAATRARRSLYLFGHAEPNGAGGLKPHARSFLAKLPHLMDGASVLEGGAADNVAAALVDTCIKRLPSAWALPETAAPVAVDAPERASRQGEPEFYWAGTEIRHIGTVVHSYFCRIAKEGPSSWGDARVRGELKRMESMLKTLGLGAKEAARASKECARVLSRAMGHERGRWILDSHAEAATELPLTAVADGAIVRVVIDRTFVDADGARWVIDYKTGEHRGGSLGEFLAAEAKRYRPQLERYEAVLRAMGEDREIRKGLYYPAHAEWVEL